MNGLLPDSKKPKLNIEELDVLEEMLVLKEEAIHGPGDQVIKMINRFDLEQLVAMCWKVGAGELFSARQDSTSQFY